MHSHIERHLAEMQASRYSPATIAARANTLSRIGDPLALTRETTRAWWETRQAREDGEPRSVASLSAEASHLRAYCRWAIQEGLMDRNPADWLPRIRQPSARPRAMTEGDLHRALIRSDPVMRRMLALAAMAGLRSAEIAAVTWEDIDRSAGVLWVREGKGRKDRSVPLSSGLLVELGDPGTGPIVGEQVTGKAVSLRIGRYLRGQGIDSTAHRLRARYATRFLAATGDLVATAEAMGHSDVSTTARYTIASGDTMRRGAEAAGRIG
jgi:integrase